MSDEKSRANAPQEEEATRPARDAEDADAGLTPAEAGSDDRLEEAEARAEQNWNEFLRARAELDNMRKRANRDLDQARQFAIERFVRDLLPVKDSLEQGLEAAREDGSGSEKLIEGKELTLRMLEKVLSHHGVEEIDPLGERFDPELHEAMTTQPSAVHPPETILIVLQKGYLLNGRLVRPARVVVARESDDGGSAKNAGENA